MPARHGLRAFIATKEHRRYVEFANAVRKHRYIGLCYGPAGIGKTLSARRYANWDRIEPYIRAWGPRDPSDAKIHALAAKSCTVFYTPSVGGGLRPLKDELALLCTRTGFAIAEAADAKEPTNRISPAPIQLLIIDEAERLSLNGLEYLRDMFDRSDMGLILTGMPGIEMRLSRYPQLYSRVGFAHEYRALRGEELTFVLQRHWRKLGLDFDDAEFTDAQAMSAITRITGGNFRLLQRLFVQIERVLAINELTTITDDVVEAARSTLVIGAT